MKNLIVVAGPSGCGKSTVGEYLAQKHGHTFIEGDQYHPQAHYNKMKAGIALTDDDRADWLDTLSKLCITTLATNDIVIVSCSSLKQMYRNVFRSAVANANIANLGSGISRKRNTISLHFLFLCMNKTKAENLVRARRDSTGHFMPPSLVKGQYEIMEMPNGQETDCRIFDTNIGIAGVKLGTALVVESWLAQKQRSRANTGASIERMLVT